MGPDTIATGVPCRPAVHNSAAVWIPEWPLQGVNYTTACPPLTQRGGAIPGHPLVGRGTSQELGGGDQQSKQVQMAKGLSGRAPPVLAAVALCLAFLPCHGHMSPCPSQPYPASWWQKLPADGDFSPRTSTNAAMPSNFHIMASWYVEGCCGINGFKLIRRMSGSSC